MENLQQYDVAIIGAGLTGLVAANQLVHAGKSVIVLEARSYVGGRTLSFAPGEQGGVVPSHRAEYGATWFWENEPLIADLAQKLAVDTFDQSLTGDALYENPQTGLNRLQGNPVDAPAKRFTLGAQEIPRRLSALIQDAGARLELDSPVERVETRGDLTQITAENLQVSARDLVLAIAPATLGNIEVFPELPTEFAQAARATATWMGDMVKAVAVYDHAFWEDMGLAGSVFSLSGLYKEFHQHSGKNGKLPAIFAFARANQFENQAQAQNAFEKQLVSYFGQTALENGAQIFVKNWSEDLYIMGQPAPHAATNYGNPALSEPVNGHLYLASTETADAFGGHMEGAVRAGLIVASKLSTR